MIFFGAESGSDEVFAKMTKGIATTQLMAGCEARTQRLIAPRMIRHHRFS